MSLNQHYLQIIMETAQVMIVGDEEHLSPAPGPLDVCRDETQDVLVPDNDSICGQSMIIDYK